MTEEWGVVVVGSYSPSQLREGELHHGWNNTLIENEMLRIFGNGGEKRKQEANSPLLPSPCESQVGNGGGGILFTLWTKN